MDRGTGAAAEVDLSKNFALESQGEMAALRNTITLVIDQLDAFAGQSTEDLERQAHLLASATRGAAKKIEEIERSHRLFEARIAQLAVSSNHKSEFIANMSHEICTSLNSILILAEQLAANPEHTMNDSQVQYARSISSSGNELMSLLSSILDLAKVESGSTTAESSVVSVSELRDAILREFEPIAKGRGVTFSIDISFDSPRTIVTDPQRLLQILKNLLSNAFKFTQQGSVHVAVAPAYRGESKNTGTHSAPSSMVAISVSDTGIGIDTDQQHRIFEPFCQGDGTTARLYGGTGLGLSISRELARLLRGEITVTSTPGVGSIFTVCLPTSRLGDVMEVPKSPEPSVERDDPAVDLAARLVDRPYVDRRSVSAMAGTKILVVDDDFRNIFTLSALLEHCDAEVTVAESGPEALAMLKQLPDIDLVCMDIVMPVMDGYAAIRAIRAMEQFEGLPIIATTGEVTPGERERCIEAGASDYMPTPADTMELYAALKPWLPTTVHVGQPFPGDAPHPPGTESRRLLTVHASAAELTGGEPHRHDSNGRTNPGIEGCKILVVEDDLHNMFALSTLLEQARVDAEVIVIARGSEALTELKRNPSIDIVLLDTMSSRMDRYDTIRSIRAVDQFKGLPIVVVTGNVTAWERQRCIDAGANDYLPKPLVSTDLVAVVQRWLSVAPHRQVV